MLLKCFTSCLRCQLIVLLISLSQPIFAQNISGKTRTDIQNMLTTMPFDSVLSRLTDSIKGMRGKNDQQVKQDVWATFNYIQKRTNKIQLAKTYQLMGKWHYASVGSEKIDSVYYYDKLALETFLKTDSTALTLKAYRYLAMDLINMQDYSEAEQVLFKIIQLAQFVSDQDAINSAHALLSILYHNTEDYSSAIKYSDMVVAAYEKEDNTHPLIRAMIIQSSINLKLQKPELALTQITKALALVKKLPEDYQNSETYNVMAWRGRVYRALKRYDDALADFQFAWKGMEKEYGANMANGWKGFIGGIYYLQGKPAEAIPFLKDYIQHMEGKKVEDIDEHAGNYLWLAKSYEALNNKDSAIKYLELGKDLVINSAKEEIKSLHNELRVKYETAQKDKTILTQDNQIHRQKKIQALSYVIGVLLLCMLGAAFWGYRNNRSKNAQLLKLNTHLGTTNTQLDRKNAENELLLKEIHHRVKNNLEVVSSLLALQSAKMDDPDMQAAMLASQNRVQSMGILHQKLYQSEHLAFIEMKNYFQNLAENIRDSYNEAGRIEVAIDMPETELDVDTAVPVGLIVNELLTNSLKYAFPGGQHGQINLSLTALGKDRYNLLIADNGIGKHPGAKVQGTGFGSQLVQLLTRQIDGNLVEQYDAGTSISINFKKPIAA